MLLSHVGPSDCCRILRVSLSLPIAFASLDLPTSTATIAFRFSNIILLSLKTFNKYILKNEKMSWILKQWTEWLKKKKGLACLGSWGESLPWTPSHAQVWTWGSMRFLCWYLHTQPTWLGTEVYICSTCQLWSPNFLRSQILFLHWW